MQARRDFFARQMTINDVEMRAQRPSLHQHLQERQIRRRLILRHGGPGRDARLSAPP